MQWCHMFFSQLATAKFDRFSKMLSLFSGPKMRCREGDAQVASMLKFSGPVLNTKEPIHRVFCLVLIPGLIQSLDFIVSQSCFSLCH